MKPGGARWAVLTGLWAALAGGHLHAQSSDRWFTASVASDTVTVAGTAVENRSLPQYRSPTSLRLLDSVSIVYADAAGGRLVSVNLLSGEGWEVADGGRDGPGDFSGKPPVVTTSGPLIFTAAMNQQGAVYGAEGILLDSGRYPHPLVSHTEVPFGLLEDGVAVTRWVASPDYRRLGIQEMPQEIRAYSRGEGRRWAKADLPRLRLRLSRNQAGATVAVPVSDREGLSGAARIGTITLHQPRGNWIEVLDADGTLRARSELEHEIFRTFVDAGERVWVQVWTKNQRGTASWIVLDRDLNPIMQVAEGGVQDAWGDFLLTTSVDEPTGVSRIHLLRLRR